MSPWLGSFPSKNQLRKVRQIQDLHGTLSKDIALLRRRLTEMKKRASYVFSEAQHHQLQLLEESVDKKVLGKKKVANLDDVCLDIMNKRLKTQEMASLSGITNLKVEVKHVAGFTEEIELLPQPSRHKRKKMKEEIDAEDEATHEKGVFRLFQLEGTVGDTAYAAVVLVRRNLGQECGKATNLINLRLGSQSPIVKQMLTPERLSLPETVYHFTSDLYYYKMLQEERQEALDQLESEVPGLEEVVYREPVVLHLLSQERHEVEVVWGLQWDDLNCLFKNNISVNCSEEVTMRYSTSDVHRYLSGQHKLKTQEEVITFAETFSDL